MAKKKTKKKAAGPKYPKKPAARGRLAANASAGTRKALAPRKAGPRSQALPGLAQVRSTRLDNLCEAIAEDRATMNLAKQGEAGSLQAALHEMQKATATHPDGRSVYKHAGVELVRVPGADKLRVRLTKDTGDADETNLAATGELEPNNDQIGDERRRDMEDLGTLGDATEIH